MTPDKFPYQLTSWLDYYPNEFLETFKKYKEMHMCKVVEKKGKYAIFTTGELLVGERYLKGR